ncbi:NAD(P)-binding protein [Daldinia loculata]|uniref:NAD(P)-binding protein n=1 Tax=Daldinia loculata TaxID=103429 RepID=UPI0020C4EC94|nr:NAD(P)-binding protein [Daldinia loculata]KAI1647429.1 NAD(P)-binding protein [Daldinia loculata]KAI2777958.1 NAD(P)-binding protein [Daldinia loculata]
MTGTIIITGANGSLAIPAVHHLLTKYPDYTAVLTVRKTEDTDPNTKKLRETIAKFPEAQTSIRQLDLANLTAVHDFASTIATEIAEKKLPPLASIVCNAYYWNLSGDPEFTAEGVEKTIQVNHISHVALVLRLLGSFRPEGGRIVLFTSNAHFPGKNGLEKYPPAIPDDLDSLLKAKPDADKLGRGMNIYGNSKLAILMWGYALNRHLEKDEKLRNITAIIIDPGNLTDSRALRTNTPLFLRIVQRFVLQPLRPLVSLADPSYRTAANAGTDVIDLATNNTYPGERGYLLTLKKEPSSPDSYNEDKQEKLWVKSAEWAKVTKENTAIASSL